MKSGFVLIIGRTGVGKSSLVNAIVGDKVSITASSTNTTRSTIRGILTREDLQIVFIDTPGVHKPKSELGKKLNENAEAALNDSPDVVLLVVDGYKGIGTGDIRIAKSIKGKCIVALNKIDKVKKPAILTQITKASEELNLGTETAFIPVSARSGENLETLVTQLSKHLEDGPMWYPVEAKSDVEEEFQIAELVREALLVFLKDELPHSLACVIKDFTPPHIKCDILVERSSQKPIILGKGGSNIERVRKTVESSLPEGYFLHLMVKVDKNWQQKAERFGYLTQ